MHLARYIVFCYYLDTCKEEDSLSARKKTIHSNSDKKTSYTVIFPAVNTKARFTLGFLGVRVGKKNPKDKGCKF